MKAILVLAFAVGVALSQTPPTISPSSTSTTVQTFANQTHQGTEYTDAQNQRAAFVHKFSNGDTDEFVGFTQNHSAYNFGTFNGTQHCDVHQDPRPWFNEWAWVAQTKAAGSCSANGQNGQAWALTDRDGTITLCANGAIPLQVSFKGNDGHTETTTFTSFVPGVPPASAFAVPANCHHH